MIKPVSALRHGDLIFYQGKRGMVMDRDPYGVIILALSLNGLNIRLKFSHPPVSVYATRKYAKCIPF